MLEEYDAFCEAERRKRVEIDGIERVILYELNNHECYYSGTIEPDLLDALSEWYGVSKDDIWKLFKNKKHKIVVTAVQF